MTPYELGKSGEEAALRYLIRKKHKILVKGFRLFRGEIDIIARNRKELIFVEVKTRRGTAFGLPQEAVDYRKQRQIVRTANWYLQQDEMVKLQPRFDVVAILCQSDNTYEIQHLQNAFELD